MLQSAENRDEMLYQDLVLLGEQYTDWKPYKHPLYGDIEIGGEKKLSSRVPPLFKLAETCHRNAAFVLYHADQLPRLKFDRVKVQKIKDRLFQIDIVVTNATVTPTISAVALQKNIHRVDRFGVEGSARLVAAGALTDPYLNQTRAYKVLGNAFWVDSGVPGFGKMEFRLMVEGKGRVQLAYDSLKGGYYQKEIELE
jgi:hypothetical protein